MPDIDLSTWGPLTTLAVIGALIVLLGGAVSVAFGHYTFGQYLNDLKPVAAALAGGAAIGRGVRLAPHAPTTRLPRARRARARKDTP
jgi:hypothetical protein